MSNWNPWRATVKYWKKDEYLSSHEVFLYNFLGGLFSLPVMFVIFSLVHRSNQTFITWPLTFVFSNLLMLIPQVQARQVKRVNRRVDKKKSKTKAPIGNQSSH